MIWWRILVLVHHKRWNMNSFHPRIFVKKIHPSKMIPRIRCFFHQNVIFYNQLSSNGCFTKNEKNGMCFYNVENVTPKNCTPFRKVLPKGCLMCQRKNRSRVAVHGYHLKRWRSWRNRTCFCPTLSPSSWRLENSTLTILTRSFRWFYCRGLTKQSFIHWCSS